MKMNKYKEEINKNEATEKKKKQGFLLISRQLTLRQHVIWEENQKGGRQNDLPADTVCS